VTQGNVITCVVFFRHKHCYLAISIVAYTFDVVWFDEVIYFSRVSRVVDIFSSSGWI